jgi:hypothetical protein
MKELEQEKSKRCRAGPVLDLTSASTWRAYAREVYLLQHPDDLVGSEYG